MLDPNWVKRYTNSSSARNDDTTSDNIIESVNHDDDQWSEDEAEIPAGVTEYAHCYRLSQ